MPDDELKEQARESVRRRFGEPRTEEDVNQIELVSHECAHFARTAIASAVKAERSRIAGLLRQMWRNGEFQHRSHLFTLIEDLEKDNGQ